MIEKIDSPYRTVFTKAITTNSMFMYPIKKNRNKAYITIKKYIGKWPGSIINSYN